jgi:hypothetical protein
MGIPQSAHFPEKISLVARPRSMNLHYMPASARPGIFL